MDPISPIKITENASLSANFDETTINVIMRKIESATAYTDLSEFTIADVTVANKGKPHLFRSVLGAPVDAVESNVLTALGKIMNGDYLGCVQYLKGTEEPLNSPIFIELDPGTQMELSGDNISLPSVLRDLGKEGYDNIQQVFDDMLNEIVSDPELLNAALLDFESLQQRDLGLINPETYAITYPDLSIRPVIIDPYQEENLSRLVSNVISAKIAIVNAAMANQELQDLFLNQMNELGKEVIGANFYPLPNHVRIRIDSHTNFEVGSSSQIETNGSEPQGDAVTSATLSLLKRTFSRLFQKYGATPEQIEYCFRDLRLPLYRVADKIVQVYQQNSVDHSDLPTSFNVGFFAWKHPKTRKPLSNISNAESEKSIAFITDNSSVKNGYSFDPFDIVKFETLEDSRYHIPVILLANGEEAPLHFIRRLYSNLSFTGPTWSVLKNESPEIYYKFTGIKHEDWNPQGRRIPEWMWMNPLNPCLTDKVLDALITDPALLRRFNVPNLVATELKRQNPSISNKEAKKQTRTILVGCKKFVPLTRCLTHKVNGLFPGDTGVGGLNEAEFHRIKVDRNRWVIKLDSLGGYSGHGIFVGKSFLLSEVPSEVISQLSSNEIDIIKLSIIDSITNSRMDAVKLTFEELFEKSIEQFWNLKLIGLSDRTDLHQHTLESLAAEIEAKEGAGYLDRARDIIWPYLIEFAAAQPKSLIQEYRSPQIFNALRLSYNGRPESGVSLSIPTPHSVDINVFAFGPEQSDFHSRGSLTGKTNITGGYGARMLVIPSIVAKSMASLFQSLNTSKEK